MPENALGLNVPAGLAATLSMRPSILREGEPVKGLTGADIALWLIIMDLHGTYGIAHGMRIEQRIIVERFGKINRVRMHEAMRRLMGTEVYMVDEDRWMPVVTAVTEHQMPRVDPRVPVAPEWTFTVDEDLVRAWRDGVEEASVLVPCLQLRELTSRYAVAIWLRFLVWPKRNGLAPPDYWNVKMPPVGTGMRADIPVEELGDLFGYDERLPPSKIAALFSTDGGSYPVVRRELIRVNVDYELVPVMAAGKSKPVAMRLRMGGRYTSLENMTSGRWTDAKVMNRPKRGKWGKRKLVSLAIAERKAAAAITDDNKENGE